MSHTLIWCICPGNIEVFSSLRQYYFFQICKILSYTNQHLCFEAPHGSAVFRAVMEAGFRAERGRTSVISECTAAAPASRARRSFQNSWRTSVISECTAAASALRVLRSFQNSFPGRMKAQLAQLSEGYSRRSLWTQRLCLTSFCSPSVKCFASHPKHYWWSWWWHTFQDSFQEDLEIIRCLHWDRQMWRRRKN